MHRYGSGIPSTAARQQRKLFSKPDVLDLGPEELLEVVKPIYNVAEFRDCWNETLRSYRGKDLNMSATTGNLSL